MLTIELWRLDTVKLLFGLSSVNDLAHIFNSEKPVKVTALLELVLLVAPQLVTLAEIDMILDKKARKFFLFDPQPFFIFHKENRWHVYVTEQVIKSVSQIKQVNI